MHVHINKSRHDKTALCIDLFFCLILNPFCDLGNHPVFYQNICNFFHPGSRIDDFSAFDQYCHICFSSPMLSYISLNEFLQIRYLFEDHSQYQSAEKYHTFIDQHCDHAVHRNTDIIIKLFIQIDK